MEVFRQFMSKYFFWFSVPHPTPIDFIEIVILSFVVYRIMRWVKNTRAWVLFKGIIVLLLLTLVAYLLQMNTIVWIANRAINVGIIAIIVVFQPELRRALEQLGRKNLFASIFTLDSLRNIEEQFDEKSVNEIMHAVYEMGRTKTGALIVIERENALDDYERTGIAMDSILSAQLLVNIFEHNTPLHDGAIIVRGNRIVSATCYLPLSDNVKLSKELGTRHRAAIGISEVSDSVTVVVSEETGDISLAEKGELIRNIDTELLKDKLSYLTKKAEDKKRFRLWKGRDKNEG